MQLPEFFTSAFDEETLARLTAGFEAAPERPTTLRANTLCATREEVAAALSEAGLAYEGVPWYEDAFVLPGVGRAAMWGLSAFEEGKFYMQSLSSMLPPLFMRLAPGSDVLDMCAAPGGKTLQMAALSGNGVHLTACEMHAPRADKLQHNLSKLGAKNVQVMRCDARRLDEFFSFDEILLDAPCTGSGTLNAQNAKQLRGFSEKLLAKCIKSQRALLDRALTVLKPGGLLTYSTCSVLPAENEDQVRAVLAAKRHRDCELVPLELDSSIPQLPCGLAGTATVIPTKEYEGFFIAQIKKTR